MKISRAIKFAHESIILSWMCLSVFGGLTSCRGGSMSTNGVLESAGKQIDSGQDIITFDFNDGDLLFQDLDCGELCDAIEKVTKGINGKKFSHIGLVFSRNDSDYVIEAVGKDVHLTSLNSFVNRNKDEWGNPKIVVGRLKSEFQKLNANALKFALSQIGTPYDDAFIYDNQKYYCSELIYDAFKYANNDRPFFQLEPMTFKEPNTGVTFPAWVEYYQELKLPIPDGMPGCNPGSISCSEKIVIVKSFY